MTTANIFRFQLVFAYLPAAMLVGAFVVPWLRSMDRVRAQRIIATFHSYRFIGLVFAVPGVAGPSLNQAFAIPAAYGDLATSILALCALATVRFRPLFWACVVGFNAVGIVDLLGNYVRGIALNLPTAAGQLGAAYFILIVYVPLLMLSHVLSIYLMVRQPAAGPLSEPTARRGTHAFTAS